MTQNHEFLTTTKASRAASTPGPCTVTALLEKVEAPNDYIHEPDFPGETASDYFALSYNYDVGPPVQQFEPPELDDRADGENARRMSDAIPVNLEKSHIVLFDEGVKKDEFSDLYGWYNDFWLISNRLRKLIEELDPGSIECIEAVSHNLTPDRPYWVCLTKRNLEAVDATRSDIRVIHKTLVVEGEEPIVLQPIYINRGAVFDPAVTKGVHHFWDIDLRRWFWSRELIARAHHAGIRGPAFVHAGKPIGGEVAFDELDEIYAEFSSG